MVTLTPEQRQAVASAGDAPIRLIDPETDAADYLLTHLIDGKWREATLKTARWS
jgi:hypothetical protein